MREPRPATTILRGLATLAIVVALAPMPSLAASGGGPLPVPVDDASREIDARAESVRRAVEAMRLPAVPSTSPAAAAAAGFLQFPLLLTDREAALHGHSVSNFVDLDPGRGLEDFACGKRTYDGHNGTDYFLTPYTWRSMDREEVAVVAAADGTVVETHDGEFDRRCTTADTTANYVILQYDNGLTGYYWHLKKGTVTKKRPGARVAVGERLGFVASSGRSTGPHLHHEVRGKDGKPIEPARGACNKRETLWSQQPAYADTVVVDVATLGAPPPGATDCGVAEKPRLENAFGRGDTVYGVVHLRDFARGDTLTLEIVRPDDTVATSTVVSGPAEGVWSAAYWYLSHALPADAPRGLWRVRAAFGKRTAEHVFAVAEALKGTTVRAVVDAPKRTLKRGKPADFAVTLRNTGKADAVGCRLSLARPIDAAVTYRRLGKSGKPEGGTNEAVTVRAGRKAEMRLTVSPNRGFAARKAEFPLHVTCTNAPPAEFSRKGTMLVLTTK
jgi:hypothetical protein